MYALLSGRYVYLGWDWHPPPALSRRRLGGRGQKLIAQGVVNGGAITIPAGSYRISILGIRGGPLPLRLENGQRVEVVLDDAGKLRVGAGK